MPPTGNEKQKVRKYSCPNPNCKIVFSRPRIIKYHVCPTCQTLVDESNIAEHFGNDVVSQRRKVAKGRRPKKTEPSEFLKRDMLDVEKPRTDQSELEELHVAGTGAETDARKKVIELELVQQVQQEKPKSTQPQPQHVATEENEKIPEPSIGCQYGFGYLSHRESGAGIPETCIECPDSLNCMLSKYHKSGESVEEISKWYK